MHEVPLETLVNALKTKVEQLLLRHTTQQATIQKLQQENEQLRATVSHTQACSLQSTANSRGIKTLSPTQLDSYIHRIDQCIAYLEQFS